MFSLRLSTTQDVRVKTGIRQVNGQVHAPAVLHPEKQPVESVG
jgi:hypothetical protein